MTHIYNKTLAPSLLVPRKFVLLFKFDQELALKIKELVEPREEVMDCVLVNYILLHECAAVVLLVQKDSLAINKAPAL